jgi:hypothetical protein
MKPTRTVNPIDEETDWDGLCLAIEKAVDKIVATLTQKEPRPQPHDRGVRIARTCSRR